MEQGATDLSGLSFEEEAGQARDRKRKKLFSVKLKTAEALSASPPTYKSILNDDEDNSAVIPLAKRSKRYNPSAIHIMAFILAIPR
ncbi:hypothetical protein TNCV_4170931 [Trichonephila clavipes]|nr:hypothetical protein TNCV_4170931 [Trichonephila clavipes]